MTIRLAATASLFGSIIGLLAAVAKMSRLSLLRLPAAFYIWAIRGIPLLLQLMFLYYGLAFAGIILEESTVAVIGLSVCSGAYFAEIIRAGIQSIDEGQTEAALSLGMNRFQTMRWVIIPQALRRLLPPMGNEIIALTKDSALVSVICMTELLRAATLLQNATFRPVEIYVTASAIYLLLTTVLSLIFNKLEKKLSAPDL